MEGIFVRLFNMSISASILILVVILLRIVLKKAPKWLNCFLWALVAVRLIFPISLTSPFSAYRVIAPSVTESGQIEYVHYVGESVRPMMIADKGDYYIMQMPEEADVLEAHNPDVYLPPVVWLWEAGMLIIFLYAVLSALRLRQSLGDAVCYRDNIWLSDRVKTPFIFGVIRPKIFLASGTGEEQMEYIIAHEQAHLARKDHFWKPLGYILLCIYWFNPLCWVAYALLCKDIELACDEKVIRDKDMAWKKAYSGTLLECSMQRKMILACPLAFGEVSVKERVKTVLHYKKPAFWIVLAAAFACIALAVCFLTNPRKDGADEEAEVSGSDAAKEGDALFGEGEELPLENGVKKTLNEAIYQAILDTAGGTRDWAKADPEEPVLEKSAGNAAALGEDGAYRVASFIKLAEDSLEAEDASGTERIVVYGMAMYMEAAVGGEDVRSIRYTSATHGPTALTFDVEDGEYVLKGYWVPGDGAMYAASIRETFPAKIAEDAMQTQNYVYENTMYCYAQVIDQSRMATFPVIGKLLDQICAPAASSNPSDYIKKGDAEYRELLYYGEYTLAYRDKFESEFGGLRREVLYLICKDIEDRIAAGVYRPIVNPSGELLYRREYSEHVIRFEGTIVENSIEAEVPVILVEVDPGAELALPYKTVLFKLPEELGGWSLRTGTRVAILCYDAFQETDPVQGGLIHIAEADTGESGENKVCARGSFDNLYGRSGRYVYYEAYPMSGCYYAENGELLANVWGAAPEEVRISDLDGDGKNELVSPVVWGDGVTDAVVYKEFESGIRMAYCSGLLDEKYDDIGIASRDVKYRKDTNEVQISYWVEADKKYHEATYFVSLYYLDWQIPEWLKSAQPEVRLVKSGSGDYWGNERDWPCGSIAEILPGTANGVELAISQKYFVHPDDMVLREKLGLTEEDFPNGFDIVPTGDTVYCPLSETCEYILADGANLFQNDRRVQKYDETHVSTKDYSVFCEYLDSCTKLNRPVFFYDVKDGRIRTVYEPWLP